MVITVKSLKRPPSIWYINYSDTDAIIKPSFMVLQAELVEMLVFLCYFWLLVLSHTKKKKKDKHLRLLVCILDHEHRHVSRLILTPGPYLSRFPNNSVPDTRTGSA